MKIRVSLKNRVIMVLLLMIAICIVTSGYNKTYAIGTGEWAGIPGEDLSQKGLGAAGIAKLHGDEAAMDYIKECNSLHPGSISSAEIESIIDQGYLTGYVEELKSLGYISSGYTPPATSSSPAPTPTPASFTVEDMEDTLMWATQIVNYRDGASTDYNKLGSLGKYEQIIVNGVASTGWYRFNTEDGTTAYVSNNYLTTEDPSNRELNIYNEETDQVDTFIFEDTDPEVIDEVIEDIKEEYAEKEPVVEELEPEIEEPVEPESAVEELPVEVEETSAHSWQFYVAIIFAVVCIVVIGVSVFFIVRNKKRGRAD